MFSEPLGVTAALPKQAFQQQCTLWGCDPNQKHSGKTQLHCSTKIQTTFFFSCVIEPNHIWARRERWVRSIKSHFPRLCESTAYILTLSPHPLLICGRHVYLIQKSLIFFPPKCQTKTSHHTKEITSRLHNRKWHSCWHTNLWCSVVLRIKSDICKTWHPFVNIFSAILPRCALWQNNLKRKKGPSLFFSFDFYCYYYYFFKLSAAWSQCFGAQPWLSFHHFHKWLWVLERFAFNEVLWWFKHFHRKCMCLFI